MNDAASDTKVVSSGSVQLFMNWQGSGSYAFM